MKNVAHISFKGGGLILPAQTPYDRELLIEHVEASTKRHGSIRLEVNRHYWTISVTDALRAVCAACSQWPKRLNYPRASTGRLSVVSTRAALCADGTCDLAPAGNYA